MVLGLVNFLLGGKKEKTPKSAQVKNVPLQNVGGVQSATQTQNVQQPTNLPDGTSANPTQNTKNQNNSEMKFEESNPQSQTVAKPIQNQGNRKPISEVITKIHEEIKNTNEKMTEMVGDIKNIENNVNDLSHKIEDLEESKKITEEKLSDFDSNLTKFLSLYELINNQYNPFVENDGKNPQIPIEISNTGNTKTNNENIEEKNIVTKEIKIEKEGINIENKDLEDSLLELDTLNIEQAAGDAVPLTNLKNNTNSLVIILSWLEYLIKKVGIDETRNTLRYYTETLRWTTPEVFFDLDKYLRGMQDKKELTNEKLGVRDHIVSLYFISKLNEKTLDEKLTKAVLKIIKN